MNKILLDCAARLWAFFCVVSFRQQNDTFWGAFSFAVLAFIISVSSGFLSIGAQLTLKGFLQPSFCDLYPVKERLVEPLPHIFIPLATSITDLSLPVLHLGHTYGSWPVSSRHTSLVVIPSNTGRKEVFPISSKQAESFSFILHRAIKPKYLTL